MASGEGRGPGPGVHNPALQTPPSPEGETDRRVTTSTTRLGARKGGWAGVPRSPMQQG